MPAANCQLPVAIPLKILSADFVTSAARADDVPVDRLAQIAVAGRSNVGKSTLLNALVRRRLARTSAAPGKTRLANIYRVTVEGGPGGPGTWSVYLVDLPGYGYARRSRASRQGAEDAARELAHAAQGYFAAAAGDTRQATAHGALLLVDSRHPGLELDQQADAWLSAVAGTPHIVATKIDKLSRSERVRNLKEIEGMFGRAPLPVSAERGEGLDELWRLIARIARTTEK
jgi:GTP-binding protein